LIINQSKKQDERTSMRKLIAGGLNGVLGVLVFAPSALASTHHPNGEFEQYGECPLGKRAANGKEVTLVQTWWSRSTSGSPEVNSAIQKWFNQLGRNCYVGSNNPMPSVSHTLESEDEQQSITVVPASRKEVTHSNRSADVQQCSFA
jgi:hypothetical protein